MSSILQESTTSDPPHLRVNLASSAPVFVTEYYGNGSGVAVSSNNWSTIYSLGTTTATNYAAEFATNVICTAGTDIGKAYNQTAHYRFSTLSGSLVVLSTAYGNVFSKDTFTGSQNGQNIIVDPTVPTTVDFQFFFIAGNTYSYTFSLIVQTCP